MQDAQQEAHETSGPAAAAHGAQSCAEAVETAHAEIKAKQNAIKRFFIGKLLFKPEMPNRREICRRFQVPREAI